MVEFLRLSRTFYRKSLIFIMINDKISINEIS